MRNIQKAIAWIAAVVGLLAPVAVNADVIPLGPAIYYAASSEQLQIDLANGGVGDILNPLLLPYSTSPQVFQSPTAYSSASNNEAPLNPCPGGPTSCVYSRANLFSGSVGAAVGIIQYNFSVIGPSGFDVPVIISAAGGATATVSGGTGYSYSAFSALTFDLAPPSSNGLYYLADNHCTEPGNVIFDCSAMPGSTINTKSAVQSNTSHTILLVAWTGGTIGFPLDISGSPNIFLETWADPAIYIDPTFPLAGQFSVVVSDGITNRAPTDIPEPSSFFLVGIALLALALFSVARHEIAES